jgi:hypothetical protein
MALDFYVGIAIIILKEIWGRDFHVYLDDLGPGESA